MQTFVSRHEFFFPNWYLIAFAVLEMWTEQNSIVYVCVCVNVCWCAFVQCSHIAFRIMTVMESRFQSNTDVNSNWIHKYDILSHMKYVGRNKLIGFSYINFNGTSFIYLFRSRFFSHTLAVCLLLATLIKGTHKHTHTLTCAWIFSERGTYWCVCVCVYCCFCALCVYV